MSKKTNSINLRSIKNKNLKSNVIFEKYNYSKLLYQDFYIRDFLENILYYNFNDIFSHNIVIQRKNNIIYIFLDYYLFRNSRKFNKTDYKIFSLRRKFRWKNKRKFYRKYFDLRKLSKIKKDKYARFLVAKKIKRKKKKFIRTPLLRFYNNKSFFIFSFKRLLILNLMLLTGCRIKLYTRNVHRLLSLPLYLKKRSYKKKIQRDNVQKIMNNLRIRGFVNNVKDLKVPMFIHLAYTSFFFKNPRLLGLFLSKVLKRNIRMFRFFFFFCSKTLLSLFIFSNLKGLKIQFKGRLGPSLRKRVSVIQFGQMPLQSIDSNVKYSFNESITIYGVCGIKIWYYYLVD